MKQRLRRGFSLLELVLVIGIFGGLTVIISSFGEQVQLMSNLINQNLQVEQELSETFKVIVTEIRSMGPSSAGAYPIVAASTSSLAFYSDIDQDGTFELVRYFFATSTFERGIVEPTGVPPIYATSSEIVKTAVRNVLFASSSFQYFGSGYTGVEAPLASPIDLPQVRVVRITVTADINPKVAPKPTTFTNTITVRNLRSN